MDKALESNPWYRLATVWDKSRHSADEKRARNQAAWNDWYSGGSGADTVREVYEERYGTKRELPDQQSTIDFSGLALGAEVDFSGFKFLQKTTFKGTSFTGKAIFVRAEFHQDTDLSISAPYADFQHAVFKQGVRFEDCEIGRAVFLDVEILNADFRGSTIERVEFLRCIVQVINFDHLKQLGEISFGCNNIGSFNIRSCRIDRLANFFEMKASMCSFKDSTFAGEFSFRDMQIHGYAFFPNASFHHAEFTKTGFEFALFSEAKFDHVKFLNCEFRSVTKFEAAKFLKSAPDFRGSKMHEGSEFHDVSWPLPPADARVISDENRKAAQEQVYAYEKLKLEMERFKRSEDEQAFFRRELRARRGLLSMFSPGWLLNYGYEQLSDYGQSLARPFAWLVAVWLAGAVALTLFGRKACLAGQIWAPMKGWQALLLSLQNTMAFLPRRDVPITCPATPALVLAPIQAILGVTFLFLIGLAIRNRFRMK